MNSEKIFDPIRKVWIKKTPEEAVRARLLEKMIHELGYPVAMLAVEKELSKFPHLLFEKALRVPKRRADIVCFAKDIHPQFPIYPLLMVECKAQRLTPRFLWQLVGYNKVLGSLFLSLASGEQVFTGSYNYEEKVFQFQPGLPSYTQLLSAVAQIKYSHSQVM
jgi:hypothetical protein